jgi:hypothetical protein
LVEVLYKLRSEIKIISKLVISKLIMSNKNILERLSEENRKLIEASNITNISEELWDILKFNVKAD